MLPAGRFDLLDDVRGGFGAVMVVDDDRRAAIGELFGDGGAEAARTAGNDGDAPQQRLRGLRIGFGGTSLRLHTDLFERGHP